MITAQVIQSCLDDLKTITKVDLAVVDVEGVMVAKNSDRFEQNVEFVTEFAASPAGSQVLQGCQYLKIYDEEDPVYVLLCGDSSEEYMIGKIAVSNIQNLITAYKERFDRNNFFQNLILDNLLLVDIYNRAKKLHIEIQKPRVVLLLEIPAGKENYAMEFLKSMFSAQSGDYVTAVDENTLIVIKQVEAKDSYAEVVEVAETTVAMMNTEAMINVRVAYGTIVEELKDVSKSYKEAKMALDVGKIFYAEKTVTAYSTLGIGRLIYQLPINLCEMFIEEIFGGKVPEELDEETLTTINTFLENNLNVSETSRQLYVHRNTLLYRLEKLEKYTGLDIRIFDDALTLKIALMVVRYMRYLESMDY
ncbi:putative uncharacterized protein [Firmicutes bacterium CAG:194]|nr:MAG: CdaR family transcriptional regulator [Firmicutes bacterium CAG_194_44_15]CCZ28337.1 putative uncharacterized protein [Firmicutes bacterium CAG:194]HCI17448.1 CdaR family transcriptional regulator [Lachnospiraceae bacterium]HCX42462.1 CdaR family transcriptional regulator [Lachnospiraceae bacterium]